MTLNLNPMFLSMLAERVAQEIDLEERWLRFAADTEEKEEEFKPSLIRLFRKQEAGVLRKFDRNPPTKAITRAEGEGISYFKPGEWYFEFEVLATPYVESNIKDAAEAALKEVGVGIDFDVNSPRAKRLIREKTFKFSREVNATTLDRLRTQLAAGLDGGESIPEIRNRVKHVFDIAKTSQADNIARKEVVGTVNIWSRWRGSADQRDVFQWNATSWRLGSAGVSDL
jgi:hypothetical protein